MVLYVPKKRYFIRHAFIYIYISTIQEIHVEVNNPNIFNFTFAKFQFGSFRLQSTYVRYLETNFCMLQILNQVKFISRYQSLSYFIYEKREGWFNGLNLCYLLFNVGAYLFLLIICYLYLPNYILRHKTFQCSIPRKIVPLISQLLKYISNPDCSFSYESYKPIIQTQRKHYEPYSIHGNQFEICNLQWTSNGSNLWSRIVNARNKIWSRYNKAYYWDELGCCRLFHSINYSMCH